MLFSGQPLSAKKDWRAKVRSDIAKIASTGRGYVKAIFVTNQYVPDKARASIEDKLWKAHSIDVRILDRTWILDRVFEHHHETLAVEELGITTPVRREVRRGPLDTQREHDLEDIERRIQAALPEGAPGFQLVADCLTAATLARGLERPRVEVDGLFARAERVASKFGTEHQQLVSAYQRAWTALFWYEDYKQLAKLYGVTEARAKESPNVYDLELLTNLWLVLYSAVRRGSLDETATLFPARTARLTAALERLSQEHHRASTALQARTLLLHVRLALTRQDRAAPILQELKDVVRRSEGLVGYPLQPLGAIVGELGGVFGDLPAYNELFETVVETTAQRAGEVAAARAVLSRGAQQLDADHPYAAIRTLGRALRSLHTHESRRDLVRALYLCASAYERVGLLWAARGTLLVAASVATNDFWSYQDVTPAQGVCYNRLKWLELQLGRVPHILAWHELDRAITGVLAAKGYDMDRAWRAEFHFDAILGILLLRTDLWYLKKLSALPGVLDELGLHKAAVALLYALGYTEDIPAELTGQDIGAQDMHAFFAKWRDQPAARELSGHPALYDGRMVTLSSNILGCRITVESENVSPCVELAESALAALEALLSTGATERMITHEPVFTISIRKNDLAEQPFGFDRGEREGRPHVDIRCQSFDPHSMSSEAQAQVKHKLFELLAHVLAHVLLFGDDPRVINSLLDEGRAIERSIDLRPASSRSVTCLAIHQRPSWQRGYVPMPRITCQSDRRNGTRMSGMHGRAQMRLPPSRSQTSGLGSHRLSYMIRSEPSIPIWRWCPDPAGAVGPGSLVGNDVAYRSQRIGAAGARPNLSERGRWAADLRAVATRAGASGPGGKTSGHDHPWGRSLQSVRLPCRHRFESPGWARG